MVCFQTPAMHDLFSSNSEKSVFANETLEAILKNCSDGIVGFNSEGKIIFWNSSLEVISGLSAKEVENADFTDIFQFIHSPASCLEKVLSGEEVEIAVTTYTFAQKNKGMFKGKMLPASLSDKGLGGLVIMHPLKDTYFLECKIFEQDSLILEVEKLAKIGRWEADLRTNYAFWSEGMYEIFEIDSAKHMKHKEFIQYLENGDKARVEAIIEEVVETGRTIDFDYNIITENKNYKYATGRAKPIKDDSGKIVKLIGYVQDISDRKKNENFLSSVMNVSLTGIAVLKSLRNGDERITDFEIMYVNSVAEKILRRNLSHLKGKRACQEFRGIKEEGFFDLFKSAVENNRIESKEHFYKYDGLANWLQFSVAKFEDGCVVNFQDITKTKHAFEEMRKSHLFLYQSQEAARVGSFEWDYAADRLRCTLEFYRIFEFQEGEEVSFKKISTRIDESDKEKVIACVDEAVKAEKAFEYEFKVNVPSGKEVYCWVKAGHVGDSPKTKRFVGSMLDVTKRRKAEIALEDSNRRLEQTSLSLNELNEELENKINERTKELQLSNNRFHLISKATKDAMYDWDFTTNELWFNDVFKSRFGKTEVKTAYDFWKQSLHPEDRERVVNSLEQSIEKGRESWRDEYRFLSNQGSYVLIMDRGYILYNEEKKPFRMVGSMFEVSDMQHIEERLKESEENYRFLAESMPQLVWITNNKGESIYSNRKWSEYTGQDYDAYRGFGWLNQIHPEEHKDVCEHWKHCLRTGEEYCIEYRLKGADGEFRWFLARGIPMRDKEGKIKRWIGTSTDIHDQKKIMERLTSAQLELNQINSYLNVRNERLKKINMDLDNLVYSASHDLRSPVRNLESLLNLLSTELKNQQQDKNVSYLFDLVYKSLHALNITIKELTELARFDEDNTIEEVINFADLMEEVNIAMKEVIEEAKATLYTEFKVKEVTFAKNNLRSILYNLISNAVKYRSRYKECIVKVTTTFYNDNYILLTVEDNGIGIRKEDIHKVFTPFKRVNYQVEGTGIGMWIIKRIIDNNGGKIEVESEPGQGTVFKIFIKIS